MARRQEIAAVYAGGVAQGVALVTFPAASGIFTSAAHYRLTSEEYGAMFLPQACTAIAASLLGASAHRRLGSKRLYTMGLAANLLSMTLLVLSQFVTGRRPLAYAVLLVGTAALGVGFGLTVPALNTLVAALSPGRVDSAVLVLNALLGLGTALAPILVAVFVDVGAWWGLPVVVAVVLAALFGWSLRLSTTAPANGSDSRSAVVPARFWVFAAFALLYGVVETVNGNWASLYMTETLRASAAVGSLALTTFWASVTAGRVLFAAIARWLPAPIVYCGLPFVTAAVLVLLGSLHGGASLGIVSFGLAGLGCSALLPLTISFGQQEMTAIAGSVASGLIASYQLGYGVAAFGVGPLQQRIGLGLDAIFGATTLVALAMAALSFVIARGAACTSRVGGTDPSARPSIHKEV